MANAEDSNQPPPPPPPPLLPPPPPPPPPVTDTIIPLNFPIATKLNQNNFLTWKSQMIPSIHGFNLSRFLEESAPDKTLRTTIGQIILNPAFDAWHRQDQMLLGWIRSSLTETIQAQVASCLTTSSLWSTLIHSYLAASQARLNDLHCQIQSSNKGSTSCIDYLNRMRSFVNELAFIGQPMSDDDLTSALLNGLGPEFNPFIISINTASRAQPFTFANLHGMLLSFEKLIQGRSPNLTSLPSANSPSAYLAKPKPGYYLNHTRPVNSPRFPQYPPKPFPCTNSVPSQAQFYYSRLAPFQWLQPQKQSSLFWPKTPS